MFANYLPLAARICLATIFLYAGTGKIFDFAGTQATMAERGLPLPGLLLLGNIVFQLVGGTLLLLGFKMRWGALLLILFLVPTTLVFHAFWADPGETTAFLKNLGLIGGLLMSMQVGPGPVSVESLLAKPDRTQETSST
ncbi:MAG: DoxX family protein [Spirulinaceae cyanobacterium RM2_2_10]|nr:DoxX family protein [Spirulinaceae cyanobacterium SM2_1_0]NJO21158.1 DoxX family protein [Spirulinaceae cyanobacterium RM2_2_10]